MSRREAKWLKENTEFWMKFAFRWPVAVRWALKRRERRLQAKHRQSICLEEGRIKPNAFQFSTHLIPIPMRNGLHRGREWRSYVKSAVLSIRGRVWEVQCYFPRRLRPSRLTFSFSSRPDRPPFNANGIEYFFRAVSKAFGPETEGINNDRGCLRVT